MLFNSYEFLLVFLPLALGICLALGSLGHARAALAWLVLASLFFYSWWNPAYLPLLLGSIVGNFVVGRGIARSRGTRGGKLLLGFGVAANLLLLGTFKYANFVVDNLNAALESEIVLGRIILPLAISFFTFQQIAYLVRSWRGQERSEDLLEYAAFVTFFPQLIAGPIVHPSEMLPQFRRKGVFRFRAEDISVGLTMFTIGFFKKAVIADGIAPVANQSFDQALAGTPLSLVSAWAGVLAYSMQLYFDFSGYGDMALGLGRMFGLRLPINFNSPYKAANIADFWRRWHVTLSRFLRDHLYIPLGGNRKGEARRQINLMLTMLLGGLWHGAGWLFVAWGGLHGLYLVVHRAFQRWRERRGHAAGPTTRLGRAAGVLLTFLATLVAWVFFRAESLPAARGLLGGMTGLHGLGTISTHATSLAWIALLLGLVWFTPNTVQLMANYEPALDTLGDGGPTPTRWPLWRPTAVTALALALVFVIAFLCLGRTSEFLYFQF